MQCAMKRRVWFAQAMLAGLAMGLLTGPAICHAGDLAFIQQASNNAMMNASTPEAIPNSTLPGDDRSGSAFVPTPELATPARLQSGNIAQSITIGNFNSIAELQGGHNDLSSAAILGGSHDNLGVVQGGSGLLSNIVLLGMQGANVAVLQPPGSAPVNMLIARLPNGAILIKR